ncbi:hypothetical protein EBA29_02529 [Bacillus velezensis]|nr:hypothetical protein EBA29_02529 [Bacillus velezensis]
MRIRFSSAFQSEGCFGISPESFGGNEAALSFYRKKNMEVIGSECNGKVLRMRGAVPPE